MKFKTLQRFFAGGFTEKEKLQLLHLCQSSEGRKTLGNAIDEGLNGAVRIPGNVWDPDACFSSIIDRLK